MPRRNWGTIVGAILGVIGAFLALILGGFIGISFSTDEDTRKKKKRRPTPESHLESDDQHADDLTDADESPQSTEGRAASRN